MKIIGFFGHSKNKRILVFLLGDGCFLPAIVTNMRFGCQHYDGRLDFDISLRTYATMSTLQLMEGWIKGEWVQNDNDFAGMHKYKIVACAIASSIDEIPKNCRLEVKIEFPLMSPAMLQTTQRGFMPSYQLEYGTEKFQVHMPGCHLIRNMDHW